MYHTNTKGKVPEFNVGLAAIDSSLKALINFQSANIDGFEKRTNDVVTTGIQIKIINGFNLPTEENDIKNLAKKIAVQLKNEVKSPDDFMSYEVFFVKRTTGVVTTNKWKSWVFKSEEL